MCDELTNKDVEAYFLSKGMSRRDFGKAGLGGVGDDVAGSGSGAGSRGSECDG